MSVKAISLDLIRTDGGTQMRVELNEETYMDYRDKWLAGVEFDPVDLFHDGSVYWLADGFHRFYGAREAKRSSIPARVHQGTQRDAVLFSVGANSKHGLRRTNADKRMAVEVLLNDPEWVKWSDRKIAEQAGVSDPFVSGIRRELLTVSSSEAAKTADEPRVGKDGKERRTPHQNGKPTQSREPGEDSPEPRHQSKPDPKPDEPVKTPFDEPLAGIDWVLNVAVPEIQVKAIAAEEVLGNAKGAFTRQRISKLVEPIHKLFQDVRGIVANAQQKARRK